MIQIGNTAVHVGDCLESLRAMPERSVNCCVTSPPYWGLRDYGTARWDGVDAECDHLAGPLASTKSTLQGYTGPTVKLAVGGMPYRNQCGKCGAVRVDNQLGLEPTPEAYVAKMVEVFREVRRVLRDDGTLWLNLGDSYANQGGTALAWSTPTEQAKKRVDCASVPKKSMQGLKPKDLVGIPWSVAKALQQPYYTGRIKSECDRVWLAATIDAEGSICGFTHERKDDGTTRTGIHITITNTNTRLLDNAFRVWPTSRQDHNAHGNGHFGTAEVYRWIAHNVDMKRQLLCEIYPHLIAKKKQAMLAWNFLEMSCEAKRLARTVESDAIKEKRAWIVAVISRLNHFEDVDVPAWCIEPPSMYETGYYLRQDIIWAKPNPMPESVTDRCTKAHEYIFLMSKSERYFYDSDSIKEPLSGAPHAPGNKCGTDEGHMRNDFGTERMEKVWGADGKRNRRSVWQISTRPYKGAHFATFPPALIEPCIKAGCPVGGTVLDPFGGSGTTGRVANDLGRNAVLCELNPKYVDLIRERLTAPAKPVKKPRKKPALV